MERDFYKTLRKVQKAERNNKGSLSRVGDDFYKKMYSYIKELEHSIQNNPFSNEEHNLLKNSQIVATEICQNREKKISDSAISNIQRSYMLFAKGRPQFDVVDTTPLNLTPEEEILYYSLMDTLKEHRSRISLDKYAEEHPGDMYSDSEDEEPIDYPDSGDSVDDSELSDDQDDDITIFSADDEDDYDYSNEDPYIFAAGGDSSADDQFDEVSKRFNQIKNAKVIDDEKYEPIEKQIADQKISRAKEEDAFNSPFQRRGSQADDASGLNEDIDSSLPDDETGLSHGAGSSLPDDEFDVNLNEEDSFPNIDPFSQDEEFNFPNPFDEQFSNPDVVANDHEDDYNQINADLDRINADLDKLSSEIPTGKKEKVEKIAVKINEKINSIIGVDEKIYGPFAPEDVVILPKLNADILIDKNKAKLVDIQ
ncbi:MAG: hypothetical protein Q4Q32_03295 [Methanobrevibacter sp.]|nr:hypothetical protein [Methanobrevibacter sp.]